MVAVVFADGFGVDLDLHALADEESARLERLVPGDVELLAVDLGGGEETGADLAPRIRITPQNSTVSGTACVMSRM